MIERDVLDGDIVIIQHADFAYPEYGRIVVIERLGEEEGMGAWTLKYLVLERPSILLRCHNPQFRSWLLDPSGQYRVRGVLLRSIRPEKAHFVDSDTLRSVEADAEWCASLTRAPVPALWLGCNAYLPKGNKRVRNRAYEPGHSLGRRKGVDHKTTL